MTDSKSDDTKAGQGMRISAVSRITGIPTDTLRAWERRYELVKPERSGKAGRVYSREDVQKLTLIKMLVDRGHAISKLASTSTEQLNELLALHNPTPLPGEILQRPLRVFACGEVLPVTLKYEKIDNPLIEIVGSSTSAAAAESMFTGKNIDVLLLEEASLQADKVADIVELFRRSGAGHCFIVYAFSNQKVIQNLQKQGFLLGRAPMKTRVLMERLLKEIPVAQAKTDVPAQEQVLDLDAEPLKLQFSMENLVQLSSIDSVLKCECPQHLADLILNLRRFEIYSADCENRDEDDAELHAYLKQASGHSRSILEKALQRVVEEEGISLE